MKPFTEKLSYSDVIACIANTQAKEKLTVISNITLTPIFQKFIYYYNNEYLVNYIDLNEYLLKENMLSTCFVIIHLKILSPCLYYHFYELTLEQVTDEINKIKEFLYILYSKLGSESDLIFLTTFESDFESNVISGQVSYQSVIDELNQFVIDSLSNREKFSIVDIDRLIYRYGYEKIHNRLNFYQTNSPYTPYGCNIVAYEILALLDNISSKTKKCLVLDCDNVLWGGIIGEDGMAGIQLSNQFIGRAYLDFQRELIKLYYQGVILCLCSKNKLDDVQNVINNHPDMLLREKFLAAKRINYKNKADNIREIAIELNITLDSMVFVDDNPYETEMVKYEIPQVATILLDPAKPYQYAHILRTSKYFHKKKITENDKLRGKQYKDRAMRLQIEKSCTNIEEYHKFLETKVIIKRADKFSVARVAELSQRTNQFNLSGQRYSLEELQNLINQGYEILYLRAQDKFGDMGLVAASIVNICENYAIIEGMYLSCRVFGRGFEIQLLNQIRKHLALMKIDKVYGKYNKTAKNISFKEFYNDNNILLYSEQFKQ